MVRKVSKRQKQLESLKRARAAKKNYAKMDKIVLRKGGFIQYLPGIHSAFQKYRPVTTLKNLGTELGIKIPDNTITRGIKSVANFLTDKLGYGVSRRSRRMQRRRR